MLGPVLTMPAGIDTDSALLRTLSASNIPDLSLVDYKISTTLPRDELPRSASFSPESTTAVPPYDPKKQLYIGVGGDASPKLAEDHEETIGRAERENVSPGEEPRLERLGRTRSLVARPKSWIQRVKGSPERADTAESDSNVPSGVPSRRALSKPPRDKSRTTSGSFVTFARRSWISSSRSPSPSIGAEAENARAGQNVDAFQAASEKLPSAPRLLPTPQQFDRPILPRSSTSPPKALSRSESTFQKIKRRPQSVLMNFTTFTSSNSSASSLPGSSLDNRSTPRTSTDKVPPIPSLNTLPKLSTDAPRRRDELWSSFRSLDNDFSKFQSKSWSLKTNVVRVALLPFLRNHASHASNRNLRPEDLDRRVAILNKWWVGILEVLDGRQNQTVSGVDRPVLLDALIAIMMRPEWRTPPSAFAPLSERSPNQSPERGPLRKQKSTESLGSSSNSQFLTDSVYHNVRNLFTQNLLSQMKFVVDKMSLRNAPASLVTFCGKTAAYAFFFVPGVAEILVRLWKLPAETLRRAADQLGLPKRISQADVDEVISSFPPHVQLLGWTGAKSAFSQLQGKPVYPILAGNIPWYGPWIARWRGRDSDLFFVFTKHYHILAEEFLLSTQALSLKARAPGFVLVQAQLLTTLDATFHRQVPTEPLPITFDDVLAGAGASAAALPLPSSNSARLMAENRLIMLLRDFLSEKPSDNEAAQLTFAGSFEKMMQATTRRISLFDHNACFVLCDFVEEALVIFIRFHLSRTTESDLIDWYFWLDVCKKMLDSQNTMSQIRLFSLLYSAWGVVTSDSTRKQVVCLDWLLTEETFGRYFNHWCPMVRAYYMRLLCWRICREYGESTDLDTAIFSTAYARLKSNWAQYLYLRQAAETGRAFLPSTAPCHPAPGRRLLIIRNDEQSPSSNLFFGFDGIMPSQSGTTQLFANKRHSLATVSNSSATESSIPKLTTDASASANKRRWSFMGKMLPSGLAVSDNLNPPTKGTSPSKTLEEARRETALARKKQGHAKSASTDSETPPSTSTHRAYTFRFSLEWTQHFDRPQNVSAGDSHLVTRERRLFPPRLPVPAHVWLGDQVPDISHDVLPKNPAESGRRSEQAAQSKYVGRALAEWALIVGEYNNFAERRQAEGVPGLKWVEIPTLGVEGFRR